MYFRVLGLISDRIQESIPGVGVGGGSKSTFIEHPDESPGWAPSLPIAVLVWDASICKKDFEQ